MIDIRQKVVETLSNISEKEREKAVNCIASNVSCFLGVVPPVYQSLFDSELKKVLEHA